MIHVAMADEDIADAQNLARREPRQIAHVEEQGAPLEHELDVEGWIAEGVIYKMRIEVPRHGGSW